MLRWEVLDFIATRSGSKKFLEIGVDQKHTFNFMKTRVGLVVGVDPHIKTTYQMTSDVFFAQCTQTFDLVFIDGLHEKDQVLRDINNSLKILEPDGTIICHDCNPKEKFRLDPMWSGNVWEAIVKLRLSRDDLKICTIDEDTGMSVITRGYQKRLVLPENIIESELNFDYFNRHRKKLLNIVSFKEYKNANSN